MHRRPETQRTRAAAASRIILVLFVLLALSQARAQESASVPSSGKKSVRISFLPPPLEGTISLGIYDNKGKLVRILHRESDVDEFQVGSDGLTTSWDGKDDDDQPLPTGKYHARGYAVGDLEVEGIGFFFNDWVSDERPERIERICAIGTEGDGVVVSAKLAPAGTESVICNGSGDVVATRPEEAAARCDEAASPPPGEPIATASGKDHTRWAIEPAADAPAASEVKQYSAGKELLRRLTVPAEDPQPRKIAASVDADHIFVVEENGATQRLRGLTLVATQGGAEHSNSDWKVDFEKKITAHKNFGIADGKPVATGGDTPPEKLHLKLLPNPLHKDERGSIDVSVASDEEGSTLETADGLPLQTISETKHLVRAVLVPHDAKSLDVFQDDGTVVEQFRISAIDQMMAFDCGEIELK